MSDNHPLHRARFALEQQLSRLRSWHAADQRKAKLSGKSQGPRAATIAQRAEEVTALLSLVDYTVKLEKVIINQEQQIDHASRNLWYDGYASRVREGQAWEEWCNEFIINNLSKAAA